MSKKIIIWILLAESALILSTRFGAFFHEFIGHGLMAEFFGGTFEAFQITLFAGGKAYFYGNFSKTASLCVSMGGIAVNLIIGIVALIVIQKRKLSFSFILFGVFLAGVNILSQVQYLILGAYYQSGDPGCLVKYPAALFLAWTGGLVALAWFSLYIMRLFFRFQNTYFPSSHIFKRATISFLILGTSWVGHSWTASIPGHGDLKPSFWICLQVPHVILFSLKYQRAHWVSPFLCPLWPAYSSPRSRPRS